MVLDFCWIKTAFYMQLCAQSGQSVSQCCIINQIVSRAQSDPLWPPMTPCDSLPTRHLPTVNSSQLIENQWLSLLTAQYNEHALGLTAWIPSRTISDQRNKNFCKIFSYENQREKTLLWPSVWDYVDRFIHFFLYLTPSNVCILYSLNKSVEITPMTRSMSWSLGVDSSRHRWCGVVWCGVVRCGVSDRGGWRGRQFPPGQMSSSLSCEGWWGAALGLCWGGSLSS